MPFDTRFTKRLDNMKEIIPVCFAYLCVLMVAGIVTCLIRGFEGMPTEYGFSIGGDLFCMGICLMLGFSVLNTRKEANGYTRIFITLLCFNMMALFIDECSWQLQGIASLNTLNLIVNVIYFANSAMFIYFFWRYVTLALNLEGKFMRAINTILNILLIPNVILCLINFGYPIYFLVEGGIYSRVESTYFISQIYTAITVIAVILALILSKANLRTKLVTSSFVGIPLLHQLLTRYTFGISTQYAAMLVSIVLIYGVLFADREKALASTSKELSLATRIQADMLPNVFPAFPEKDEFDIYATMEPAKEVGGDFYDFFLIDNDHLGVVMADVSGKGVPAALFMMVSKILVQNYAMMGKSPKEVLECVNNQICKNNKEDMFVTVWFGILDLKTGNLKASNAGHEYPAIKKADGTFELYRDKHGFVIGSMAGITYSEYELTLEPGSKLFLYTDGVAEATNSDKNLFGTDRMIEALRLNENLSPEEVIKSVNSAIVDFVKDAPQFDDITMLCLDYIGSKEENVIKKELTFEAKVENIPGITDLINSELEAVSCPMKAQLQIDVVIDEILANISSYAYTPNMGSVTIRLEIDKEKSLATISFIDQGTPYNPLENADPDIQLSVEEREIGGLGIFLIKKTMDDVSYEYKDGHNILTIKKNIESEG